MPLAKDLLEAMAQDLDEDGWLGEAEDCRELVNTLGRETGQDESRG